MAVFCGFRWGSCGWVSHNRAAFDYRVRWKIGKMPSNQPKQEIGLVADSSRIALMPAAPAAFPDTASVARRT